jgi:hypothetical protein
MTMAKKVTGRYCNRDSALLSDTWIVSTAKCDPSKKEEGRSALKARECVRGTH